MTSGKIDAGQGRLEGGIAPARGEAESDAPTGAADPAEAPTKTSASPERAADCEQLEYREGSCVGRYVLLSRIGAGAMGIVYEAYDPQLDRRIALKLHPARGQRRSRVLREAQALAQIRDPHVVAVHDVGTAHDDVFIAMELVSGPTLRTWLRLEQRSRSEILRALAAAGRGLAAVHRAGLVHRDIKPDNIIVADDGRVRIADFGLARLMAEDSSDPRQGASSGNEVWQESNESSGASHLATYETQDAEPTITARDLEEPQRLLNRQLTRFGSIAGTPAYMPPERLRYEQGDVRSDQWSFCVTAWEALCGARPFAGKTVKGIRDNILAGRRQQPPKSTNRRLQRALDRGLRAEPNERFPTMDALLAAIAPPPRRAMIIAGGLAVASMLIVSAVALAQREERSATARCIDSGSRFDRAWNATEAGELRSVWNDALGSSGRVAAAQLAERLTQYRETWQATHRDACEATYSAGTQSGLMLDRRVHCLDQRLGEVDALIRSIQIDVDAELVANALRAAASLPSAAECDDSRLLSQYSLPAAARDRAAVDELEHELAQARTDLELSRYPAALATAQRAVELARKAAIPFLLADALLLLGRSHYFLSQDELAESSLLASATEAARAGDDLRLADAWVSLADVVQRRESRAEAATALIEVSSTAIVRAGEPPRLRARLHGVQGRDALVRGNLDRAAEHQRRELELLTDELGADHPDVAHATTYFAATLRQQSRFDEARALLAASGEVLRRQLGPWHPQLGGLEYALGFNYSGEGNYPAALEHYQRALSIYQSSLGENAELTVGALNAIGSMLGQLHRLREALPYLKKALSAQEALLGPNAPRLAYFLHNVGSALVLLGRPGEALPIHQRGLALRETVLGAKGHAVVMSVVNLCETFTALRRFDEADANCARALDILAATPDADPDLAQTLLLVANIRMQQRRWPEAARSLAEAQRRLTRSRGPTHPLMLVIRQAQVELAIAQGRSDAAIAELDALIETATQQETHDDTVLAKALHLRGTARASLGNTRAARGDLRAALELRRTLDAPLEHAASALALARLEPASASSLLAEANEACAGTSPIAGGTCAAVARMTPR